MLQSRTNYLGTLQEGNSKEGIWWDGLNENMNRLSSKGIISQVLQDIRLQTLEYVLKVRQTASSMKVLGRLVYSRE